MRPRHPARTGLQGADSAPPVTAADSTSVTRNPQHPDPVSVHYSLHNDHAQNLYFWIRAQAHRTRVTSENIRHYAHSMTSKAFAVSLATVVAV